MNALHGFNQSPVYDQNERAPQKSEYNGYHKIGNRLLRRPLSGTRVGYDEYGVVQGEHHGQRRDRGRPEHDRADSDEGASFRADVLEDLGIGSTIAPLWN